MSKLHTIRLGDEVFHARSGQLLLDAALLGGVDLPHDCRAGRCGACLTRVCGGITLGGETRQSGIVHACQARVFSDLALAAEAVPPVSRTSGKLLNVAMVADGVFELTIAPSHPFDILPGQFCRFTFRGHSARPFSPTAALTMAHDDGRIRLHIKRVRHGRVTGEIGNGIRAGQKVGIEGPFGHAFLRGGQIGRLVLIGSGTGFAPIWAIAVAALRENVHRPIVLIAASRKIAGFYMASALEALRRFSSVSVVAMIEELQRDHGLISAGYPIDGLPHLSAADTVYAAGSPVLVDAVGERAQAAGALFYADPFEMAAPPSPGWLSSARAWLQAG